MLARVAAALSAVAFTGALPVWMLARGTDPSCNDAAATEEEPTPAVCERRQRWWLMLPSLAPWTRSRALDALGAAPKRRASLELARATRRTPDADARDDAARRSIAIARATSTGSQELTFALGDAFNAGAYGVVASQRVGNDLRQLAYVQKAARALGDVDALRAAAWAPPPSFETKLWSELDDQGPLLCLLGRDADGVRAVEHQVRLAGTVRPQWRETLLLCGGSPAVEPYREHVATLSRWLRLFDERVDWVALLQKPQVRVASPPTRLPVLAMALAPLAVGPPTIVTEAAAAASAALSLRQVLALAAPRYGVIVMPAVDVMPYALATRRAREPLPLPLAALEAAAERVEELARTAPPELPDRDRSIELALEAHAAALERPAEALRHTAWALWYEAAAERWWRGDLRGARRALARSVAVAPERMELFTAALALLVGEPAIALTQAERSRKDDGVTALLVDMQRALALAALGRPGDALTAAAAADVRARQSSDTDLATPGNLLRSGIVGDPRVRRADAAWLHAAMAVLAARAQHRQPDQPMTAPEWWSDRDDSTFAFHWKLACTAEATRVRERAAAQRPLLDGGAVVVPQLVVLGAGAADGAAETWLDAQTSSYLLQNGRAAIWARAEAARWRGDAAAARTWDERGERLARLSKDDRTAVLAKLAGL